MHDWLRALLRQNRDTTADDDSAQPRIRDADGEQLAQLRATMHAELESIDVPAAQRAADLGIESTERRRVRRAQTRRKPR